MDKFKLDVASCCLGFRISLLPFMLMLLFGQGTKNTCFLAATLVYGDGSSPRHKSLVIVGTKRRWKCLQVSIKISSGGTWTAALLDVITATNPNVSVVCRKVSCQHFILPTELHFLLLLPSASLQKHLTLQSGSHIPTRRFDNLMDIELSRCYKPLSSGICNKSRTHFSVLIAHTVRGEAPAVKVWLGCQRNKRVWHGSSYTRKFPDVSLHIYHNTPCSKTVMSPSYLWRPRSRPRSPSLPLWHWTSPSRVVWASLLPAEYQKWQVGFFSRQGLAGNWRGKHSSHCRRFDGRTEGMSRTWSWSESVSECVWRCVCVWVCSALWGFLCLSLSVYRPWHVHDFVVTVMTVTQYSYSGILLKYRPFNATLYFYFTTLTLLEKPA